MGNKAMGSGFAIKQTELDGNQKLRWGQGQGGKKNRINKIGGSTRINKGRNKRVGETRHFYFYNKRVRQVRRK